MKKIVPLLIIILLFVFSGYVSGQVPVYLSSKVENATHSILEMAYSESLASVIPSTSAFAVKVNGIKKTVYSVYVEGVTVRLYLASPIINGDVLTVSYTQPSIRRLQSLSGSEAASITDEPVTNNCLPSAPVTITDIDGNIYNTVEIGTQLWMSQNLKVEHLNNTTVLQNAAGSGWDIAWFTKQPAYCYYSDMGGTYKGTYGAMYNWFAVNSGILCPVGWHVPSLAAFKNLARFLDGDSIAGGKLKETGTDHWDSPNNGATNESQFTGLPGGYRGYSFSGMGDNGDWWSSTVLNSDPNPSSGSSWYGRLYADGKELQTPSLIHEYGISVRCMKDATPTISTTAPKNVTYESVVCGGNTIDDGGLPVTAKGICWNTTGNPTILDNPSNAGSNADNFEITLNSLTQKTTYYLKAYATNINGTSYGDEVRFTTYKSDAINDIDGNYYNIVTIGTQVWMAENLKVTHFPDGGLSGSYCVYDDLASNKDIYGGLYSWSDARRVCPTGWRLPSDSDWVELADYLGGKDVAGDKLKETGTAHWEPPNLNATDEVGFSGLPAGSRSYNYGTYAGLGTMGNWWSLWYPPTGPNAYAWRVFSSDAHLYQGISNTDNRNSVRCLKDFDTLKVTNTEDSGFGSLREAINKSNLDVGPDLILFKISGNNSHTIQPLTPLPEITSPLVIDGFSQMASLDDTTTLLIKLDGSQAGTGANGLTINTSNCVVRKIIISNFSEDGIRIIGGTGNLISENSIYGNGGLGINLGTDGVTINDSGDGDTGPNLLQNFPVLESASFNNGFVTVTGSLNTKANSGAMIEVFASKAPDNSGYGEGQTCLGIFWVSTDGSGDGQFTQTFPINTTDGDVITATAYDPYKNSSEFSKAIGGLPDQVLNGIPFHYMVNGDGVPMIPGDTILKVVNRSFSAWEGVQTAAISFAADGPTTSKYASASDGINLVSFTDDQYPFSPGVLAITAKTTKVGATDAENKIMDADIVFNPSFVKSSVYNLGIADNLAFAGYFDIQSIVTHEIGHILGLLHSGVYYSTMFFQIGRGIEFRSLGQDDKSWTSYKYPLSSYHGFGSVSGNIAYGYDNQPVAGALVLAINTATKDTVHSYSDANGHYLVPGLVQGSYNLFIEPLDGNVYGRPLTSRNISLYIYLNTKYTDYPGEFYSGSNESDIEATDIVTSVIVNAGAETIGKNFKTNIDITPPTVVSVTPPNPKVSPDILIKFSEPVAISTFTTQSCYLLKSGDTTPVGGSYTVMGDSTHIILFTPVTALNYSTSYTLHITSGVTDLKGNGLTSEYQKSFTTGQGDLVAPTVTDVIPAEGADSIFVTQKIMLFFSEPMDKTSVESSLSITPAISPTLSWDNENKVITVTHSVSFGEGQTYTVTLTKGAKDLSGNAMASNKTFVFNTVLAAAPAIIYLGPGNNSTNITIKTPVVVDFSEPINTLTVNSSTFRLTTGGNSVSGSIEFLNDNSRAIFRPAADLEFGTTYSITLTTGITDVSPNVKNLLNGSSTNFTTATAPTKPHVDYIDPPAGDAGSVVLISGSGFDPNPANNTVAFNGINSSTVPAVISGATLTSLTVVVPVGATPGPFVVKSNGISMDNVDGSTYFYVVPQTLFPPCDQLVSNITTGGGSRDVAAPKDGATAYVTNSGSNSVSVIDLTTLTTKYSISVGETPMKIDISPDGSRAYVTNFTSHTVSVIDLGKNPEVVIKTINVGINPYGVAVSPDGKYVYVANYTSQNISIIDSDPNSGGFDHAVANVNTGTGNRDAAIHPDAGMLAVAGDDGLKLIRINRTATGFDYVITNSSSGSKTRDVDMNTNGALAFVTTLENELMVIDVDPKSTYFGAVVANTNTGSRPGDVKGDFNGMFIYITNPDNNQVSVYQINGSSPGNASTSSQPLSLTLFKAIDAGTDPEGLFINPKIDAYQLLVVNSGGLSAKSGSVSVFRICCAANTASEDIGNVIFVIQDMVSRKVVSRPLGDMLISKMNDALQNIAKGKTKTAINSLTTFIGKVNDLMRGKQIPTYEGNELIDAAKRIIAKLQVAKSLTTDTLAVDIGKLKPDLLTVSKLGSVFPNPFNETITINYEIADNQESINKVLLRIYDMGGRLVKTLVDQSMQPGRYSIDWDGRYENGGRASYGTYFVLFINGDVKEVKPIMLVR